MKKALTLLLTLALALTLTLPGQADEAGEKMQASSWAVAELERAWEAGAFPEEIDPYRDDCTREMIRAEFAAITVRLYELMGGDLHMAPSFQQLHPHPFTDIDNYDYNIREAYGLGFVNGVETDRFAPNGTLTREQAAAMLGRVYEKVNGAFPKVGETTFADNGRISAYAVDAVAFLALNGVVGGIGGNEFAPKKALTVQEAVVMTLRMLEVETWTLPDLRPTAFQLARSDMSFFATGEMYDMKARFTPSYATAEVIWASEDPEVATVSPEGRITAVGPGVTNITATVEGVGTERCIIRCLFQTEEPEPSPDPEETPDPEATATPDPEETPDPEATATPDPEETPDPETTAGPTESPAEG